MKSPLILGPPLLLASSNGIPLICLKIILYFSSMASDPPVCLLEISMERQMLLKLGSMKVYSVVRTEVLSTSP